MLKPTTYQDISKTKVLALGSTIFILLAVLNAYFFQERSLGDTGWRVFFLINSESFCLSHNRAILAMVQWLPLIFVHLKTSLSSVLVAYSIGDVIYYYGFFLLSLYYLNSRKGALAIVFVYVFSLGSIYFVWPDLEKHLFLPAFVFYAFLLKSDKAKTIHGIIFLALSIFLMLNAHPICLLPIVFLLALELFEKRFKFIGLNIILITAVLILNKFKMDEYESVQFSMLKNAIGIESTKFFQQGVPLLLGNFTIVLLFCALVYTYLKKKHHKQIVLLGLFGIAYLIIVLQFVPGPHQDPYLLPFGGLLVVLFFQAFDDLFFNKGKLAFLGLLFVFDLFAIVSSSAVNNERISLIREVTQAAQKTNIDNAVVLESEWESSGNGSAYLYAESILLSSLNANSTTGIVLYNGSLDRYSQIKAYFSSEDLAKYFENEPGPSDTSQVLEMINVLYKEEFMPHYKMWFMDNLNQDYFLQENAEFIILHKKE